MAESKQMIELLDEMAVKILVIEPGDLSSVGDLIEILEKLGSNEDTGAIAALSQMVDSLKTTVEKMIMGELSDSAETYDHLGQAVSYMQSIARSGEADANAIHSFCESLNNVGCTLDEAELFGIEEEGGADSDEELDTRFLRDKELLECFLEEAEEHLGSIESNIISLEKNPDDTETINTIFRAFHTIKGTSGSVHLDDIAVLAHATENLLDDVRNGRHVMDAEASDVVLQVTDLLLAMLHTIKDVYEHGVDQYRHHDITEQLEKVKAVQAGEKN